LLIKKLPDIHRPNELNKKLINELLVTDAFWELELFQSKEKWAVDPLVRKAIMAMYLNLRAMEEIEILASEVQCYMTWLIARLDAVEFGLSMIQLDSLVGQNILQIGLKTADALRTLRGLETVKLTSDEKFQKVNHELKGIITIDFKSS
jgi:hypothetical protein